jgi:hypothetical protein
MTFYGFSKFFPVSVQFFWGQITKYYNKGHTVGFSETNLAQFRMRRIASILVSGKLALHANSERHFTASWNESMVAEKYFSKIVARKMTTIGAIRQRECQGIMISSKLL